MMTGNYVSIWKLVTDYFEIRHHSNGINVESHINSQSEKPVIQTWYKLGTSYIKSLKCDDITNLLENSVIYDALLVEFKLHHFTEMCNYI